jgi:hypothetical protein
MLNFCFELLVDLNVSIESLQHVKELVQFLVLVVFNVNLLKLGQNLNEIAHNNREDGDACQEEHKHAKETLYITSG